MWAILKQKLRFLRIAFNIWTMNMVVCIFIVSECLNFSSVYLKTPVATLNRNICPSSAIVSWHEMCFTGSRHISLISEQDLSSSSTWSMASLLLQSQWLMWCVTVSFPAPVIEKIKCTGTNILCTLHFGWVCLNCLDGSGLEFWFRKTCENVRSDLWNRFKLQIAVGHLFGQLIFSDWTVKWSILKRFKMYINLANMCTFKKDLKCLYTCIATRKGLLKWAPEVPATVDPNPELKPNGHCAIWSSWKHVNV